MCVMLLFYRHVVKNEILVLAVCLDNLRFVMDKDEEILLKIAWNKHSIR